VRRRGGEEERAGLGKGQGGQEGHSGGRADENTGLNLVAGSHSASII
jgi:hypothetical protein